MIKTGFHKFIDEALMPNAILRLVAI